MSRCRRYPAYKDSGVEWIGRMPEHTIIALLKERRAVLITAAVTGQIDLRGAIPHITGVPA